MTKVNIYKNIREIHSLESEELKMNDENELDVILEQDQIDKIFKEVGFKPVEIPEFDPDDIVLINEKTLKHYPHSYVSSMLSRKANTYLNEIIEERADWLRKEEDYKMRKKKNKKQFKEKLVITPVVEKTQEEQKTPEFDNDIDMNDNYIYAIYPIDQDKGYISDNLIAIMTKKETMDTQNIWILFNGKRYLGTILYSKLFTKHNEFEQYNPYVRHEFRWIYTQLFEDILEKFQEANLQNIASWIRDIKQEIFEETGFNNPDNIITYAHKERFYSCDTCFSNDSKQFHEWGCLSKKFCELYVYKIAGSKEDIFIHDYKMPNI